MNYWNTQNLSLVSPSELTGRQSYTLLITEVSPGALASISATRTAEERPVVREHSELGRTLDSRGPLIQWRF